MVKKRKPRKKKARPPPSPPLLEEGKESPLEIIRRNIEWMNKRKLKRVAERPLPSTMTAAELEDELGELLGDD